MEELDNLILVLKKHKVKQAKIYPYSENEYLNLAQKYLAGDKDRLNEIVNILEPYFLENTLNLFLHISKKQNKFTNKTYPSKITDLILQAICNERINNNIIETFRNYFTSVIQLAFQNNTINYVILPSRVSYQIVVDIQNAIFEK